MINVARSQAADSHTLTNVPNRLRLML